MTPDVYGALVDEAKKRGILTSVHIVNLKDAKGAIQAGTNIIAHSVRDQNVDQALIDMMKKNNVGYIPTLTRDLSVFVYESTPAFLKDPFFLKGMKVYKREVDIVSDPGRQAKVRENKGAQTTKTLLAQGTKNLKLLSDGGVTIAMGTDSGVDGAGNVGRWQGYFEQVEMEMMVKGWHDPDAGAVASTSNGTQISGPEGYRGHCRWASGPTSSLTANPFRRHSLNTRKDRRGVDCWTAIHGRA